MIRNKICIYFLMLILGACGSFEDEKVTLMREAEKKDLVNSFDLSSVEADKFKVKDSTAQKVENQKLPDSAKTKKTKGKVKDKTATMIETPKEAVFQYPSDYPALFRDYDSVSKSIWDKHRHVFFQGEQSIIAISYLGVVAGYITMSSKEVVKIGDQLAYHYIARFKSKEAYRYFYWLDDSIESFIDKNTFLPIKYSLLQREKKQNVDDLQLFDHKRSKVFTWYKRVKPGANKDEHLEKYIPRYLQDSFSALQFVRGLPMKKGEKFDFPVSTRGETWLLKIEVMGEEKISVNDKDQLAYRLKAETHFPGVLQKSGDINFWYSADDLRKLLKFQAKVKLGSIYGELVEYKPGVPVK